MANDSARFDLLDGARGVAAIAVMFYHYTNRTELKWLMGAWVAVDLFFVLSGFVIALSYGRKIREGMSFWRFAWLRLLRLTPLYIVALLLGYAGMLLAAARPDATVTVQQATQALAMGAAWLPWFNDVAWPLDGGTITGAFYPLNDPAWSLAFELLANALFFYWVAAHRSLSNVVIVALAMGVFIAGSLALWQFNPGFGEVNYTLGFPRVIGEFFLGALVFQRRWHQRRYPVVAVIGVSAAALMLMFPEKRAFAIANSWLLIPLVVPLLASVQVAAGGIARRACRALGEVSYPIYVLHVPICRLVFELMPANGSSTAGRALLTAAITLALAVVAASLDTRLRRELSGWSLARRPSAQVTAF